MTETIDLPKTCGFESPGWMFGRCLPRVWVNDSSGSHKDRTEERLKDLAGNLPVLLWDKVGSGQERCTTKPKGGNQSWLSTKEDDPPSKDDV